jgi:hypothetical protein
MYAGRFSPRNERSAPLVAKGLRIFFGLIEKK